MKMVTSSELNRNVVLIIMLYSSRMIKRLSRQMIGASIQSFSLSL
jgi:hypothetical protein